MPSFSIRSINRAAELYPIRNCRWSHEVDAFCDSQTSWIAWPALLGVNQATISRLYRGKD